MKKIMLVGHHGNMGQRYAAILKYLGIPYHGIEYFDSPPTKTDADGIIIATPTKSHLADLAYYCRFNIPILCEKPVCKMRAELDIIMKIVENLNVVNQYAQFKEAVEAEGDTFIDYYNTGKDGIVWDCINLIGLAKRNVYLKSENPVWSIILNGVKLSREFVDVSYVNMIKDWIDNPLDNKKYIYESTNKVLKYEENKGRGRYSGEEIFIEITGKDN